MRDASVNEGLPSDFFAFESQVDGVPNATYFFVHLCSRINGEAGAVINDPVTLACEINIAESEIHRIMAFLQNHGLLLLNEQGSATLTERGSAWWQYFRGLTKRLTP